MKEHDPLARWNTLLPHRGERVLARFAGVADASDARSVDGPGELLLERDRDGVVRVVEVGGAGDLDPGGAPVRHFPGLVALPAFANAHAHLDLTHIGPRGYDPRDGFASWVGMVLAERARNEAEIRASARLGIERSLAGGVVGVGDIAGIGRVEPLEELRRSPLAGASFVEFFGLADRQEGAVRAMRSALEHDASAGGIDRDGVRFGLQPHALYSAGPRVFEAAAGLAAATGAALSTHLAESIEEREFVAHATGPMRDFLERLGPWSDECAVAPGESLRPVEAFARVASGGRWLLAHLNDATPADIETLARLGASVAFCARGHRYFGHLPTLGEHRLRDMLRAGVNACLATDSVINLPPAQAGRISPLDDARELVARGVFDAGSDRDMRELLRTITVNPARALGLRPELFSLGPGPVMGIVGVSIGEGDAGTIASAMRSGAPPVLLALSDKRSIQAAGILFG